MITMTAMKCAICGKEITIDRTIFSPYDIKMSCMWMGGQDSTHKAYCNKCEAGRWTCIDILSFLPPEDVRKVQQYITKNIPIDNIPTKYDINSK